MRFGPEALEAGNAISVKWIHIYVKVNFRWRSISRRKLLGTALSWHLGLVGSGCNWEHQEKRWMKSYIELCFKFVWFCCEFGGHCRVDSLTFITLLFSQPSFQEKNFAWEDCSVWIPQYSCLRHDLPVLKGKIWACYNSNGVLFDKAMKASLDLNGSIYKIFTKNTLSL